MGYEIYWISGSPHAWTVLLAMEVKGLAYESHLLDRSRDEHKAAVFLAINPRDSVPVPKLDDTGICEAIAILSYLDKKHPEPSLFGTTPEHTDLVWQLVLDIDGYIRGPLRDGITMPIFRGKVKDGDATDALKAARGPAHVALSWVKDRLAGGDFLAGDGISADDIQLLPVMQVLTQAAGNDIAAEPDLGILSLAETYPAIGDWLGRMEALPGYGNAYPPYWRG